jgi:alkylhydroperoxidase/carboxymuconolactone decarboxylase family protein YurZ
MKENKTMAVGNSESTTPVSDAMRAKGDWNPAWDQFAALDPEWTERFMAMAATPIAKGILDPKVYEFLAIAVDASCTHMYAPGVRRHIRKALELGATKGRDPGGSAVRECAGHSLV